MRDGGPDELGGRRHEREMLALASLEIAGKDQKRKDEGPDENRVAAQPADSYSVKKKVPSLEGKGKVRDTARAQGPASRRNVSNGLPR